MPSIARILAVLLLVGGTALASPIVGSRSDALTCLYDDTIKFTCTVEQAIAMKAGKTDVPKEIKNSDKDSLQRWNTFLDDCCKRKDPNPKGNALNSAPGETAEVIPDSQRKGGNQHQDGKVDINDPTPALSPLSSPPMSNENAEADAVILKGTDAQRKGSSTLPDVKNGSSTNKKNPDVNAPAFLSPASQDEKAAAEVIEDPVGDAQRKGPAFSSPPTPNGKKDEADVDVKKGPKGQGSGEAEVEADPSNQRTANGADIDLKTSPASNAVKPAKAAPGPKNSSNSSDDFKVDLPALNAADADRKGPAFSSPATANGKKDEADVDVKKGAKGQGSGEAEVEADPSNQRTANGADVDLKMSHAVKPAEAAPGPKNSSNSSDDFKVDLPTLNADADRKGPAFSSATPNGKKDEADVDIKKGAKGQGSGEVKVEADPSDQRTANGDADAQVGIDHSKQPTSKNTAAKDAPVSSLGMDLLAKLPAQVLQTVKTTDADANRKGGDVAVEDKVPEDALRKAEGCPCKAA